MLVVGGCVFVSCLFIASRDEAPRIRVFEVAAVLVACFFAVAPAALNFPPGLGFFVSLLGVAAGFGIGRWSATDDGRDLGSGECPAITESSAQASADGESPRP